MRRFVLAIAMLVLPMAAQEQKQHFTINVGTPEGMMLQTIGQEPDDEKKLALAKDFLAKYPKHEGAGWVASQLEAIYTKQKEYDKAIEVADQALANSPDALDVAYNGLKAAEGKEDPALVKTWSARTSAIAKKEIAANQKPADDDAKQRLEYAQGVSTYADYALYALAAKLQDPKQVVELGAALQEQNIKSQYMSMMSELYINALSQSGQAGKICGVADKLAAASSKDAYALVNAANCSLQKNGFDRAASEATRAIEAINSRAKPEGVSEADWANERTRMLGQANWIAGFAYASQGKYGPADKALRAALPAIKGSPQQLAGALFQLGLSNYNLGKTLGDKARMREGLHYFQQCSEMTGAYQDQALRNVRAIKSELGIVR